MLFEVEATAQKLMTGVREEGARGLLNGEPNSETVSEFGYMFLKGIINTTVIREAFLVSVNFADIAFHCYQLLCQMNSFNCA
jgi:hypothetical protein